MFISHIDVFMLACTEVQYGGEGTKKGAEKRVSNDCGVESKQAGRAGVISYCMEVLRGLLIGCRKGLAPCTLHVGIWTRLGPALILAQHEKLAASCMYSRGTVRTVRAGRMDR
jgi:hypothetical protein